VMTKQIPNHSSVCIATAGNWTKELHAILKTPSSRPGWVYGPFLSPFSSATSFDNMIVVASGIGITPVCPLLLLLSSCLIIFCLSMLPIVHSAIFFCKHDACQMRIWHACTFCGLTQLAQALSVIVALQSSRQINLVWMCREPELIEYYLHHVPLSTERSWSFIYYTGKRKLVLDRRLKLNRQLKIFKGRPNLEDTVCNIVDNVSGGIPIAAEVMQSADDVARNLWDQDQSFGELLERLLDTYS